MLAGHTHGGQIRMPITGPILAPSLYGTKYAIGTFYKAPTLLHVSRGVSGLTPVRYNCRPGDIDPAADQQVVAPAAERIRVHAPAGICRLDLTRVEACRVKASESAAAASSAGLDQLLESRGRCRRPLLPWSGQRLNHGAARVDDLDLVSASVHCLGPVEDHQVAAFLFQLGQGPQPMIVGFEGKAHQPLSPFFAPQVATTSGVSISCSVSGSPVFAILPGATLTGR